MSTQSLSPRTSSRRQTASGVMRPIVIAAAYLVLWYPLDRFAQGFRTAPEVSLWYPPFALDFVLLLVFGLRYSPLLILNTIEHELFVAHTGLPLIPVALFDLATTAVNVAACVLLLRVLHINPRLRRLRDTSAFLLIAVLIAPLGLSVSQVCIFAWQGLFPWSQVGVSVLHSWAGVATGNGLLVPPLLIFLRRWPTLWATGDDTNPTPVQRTQRSTPLMFAEGLLEAIVIIIAVILAYRGPNSNSLDYTYVLFLPVLWIAARRGFEATAFAVLLLNIAAVFLVGGQVTPQSSIANAIALQFGLMTVTVTGLFAGSFMQERRLIGEQLQHQTSHDPLTGLSNRTRFREQTAQMLAQTARTPTQVGVLTVDLDNFRAVNDRFGHLVGDLLLVEAGQRLTACVNARDAVARLGGDEFAVLHESVGDAETLLSLAQQIAAALRSPFTFDNHEFILTTSIGIARSTGPTDVNTDDLMRNADAAMYVAKRRERGGIQLFDMAMHAPVFDRLDRENELQHALTHREFIVYYQPIVQLSTRRIVAVEALVRWQHPTRGTLPPAAFIPLAEETGLIVPLGTWVLQEACRQTHQWHTQFPNVPPLTLAVNLSAAQLQQPTFVENVRATVQESALDPGALILEITENMVVDDPERQIAKLNALKVTGIRIALDDFGIGYSSLSALRQLPLDVLKLDRTFTASADGNDTEHTFARVIVALGDALKLTTIAEGIETETQLRRFLALGCNEGQGYYFARPIPAAEIESLLA